MIKAVFYFEDNTVTIHSENTKNVTNEILPGFYNVTSGQNSTIISLIDFKEIHKPFPNQQISEVLDTLNKFLIAKNKAVCNQMGYIYKLNFLLYGKQGVGKTALINFICNGLIKNHGAIVFRVDNINQLEYSWKLAEEIRRIQDNLVVFILDEFEQYCESRNEGFIKNLLDGNRSIENSVLFGATNYFDKVPPTLRDRPSRIRVVSEIKPISSKKVIKGIIVEQNSKLKKPFFTDSEIDELSDSLVDSTVDEIKTTVIDKMMNIGLGLDFKINKIGFSSNEHKTEETEEDDCEKENDSYGSLGLLSTFLTGSFMDVPDISDAPFNHKSD